MSKALWGTAVRELDERSRQLRELLHDGMEAKQLSALNLVDCVTL